MPSASMLNDATPLPSITTPNKKPKLVTFELKSNYSDSDGEKVKGTDDKAVNVGAKREMIWKGWQPLSTLDRENLPRTSYLHFRYTMKGKSSGQGDQELPVLMVFDSFICTPDGDNAIRGAVIEDIDDLSIDYDEFVLNLRTGHPRIVLRGKSTNLNGMNMIWKRAERIDCDLCGKEVEDVYHIMISCQHYIPPRKKFLKLLSTSKPTRETLTSIIFSFYPGAEGFGQLFNFWDEALRIRNFYYSCIGEE